MNIEIFDEKTVRECLSIKDCIPLMAEMMVARYHQQTIVPQRLVTILFDKQSSLMVMPAALQAPAIAGVKTLSLIPNNATQNRPVIQGVIVLFDLSTGEPIALVDAVSITAIRTAAASAAATQVLAREDAEVLTLLGTGPQAQSHLHAMLAVRPIKQVYIYGRSPDKTQSCVQQLQTETSVPIQAMDDREAAIRVADIICTLTASCTPIVKGEWLKAGVHLNMVGSHSADAREVDTATILRARVFVEERAAAMSEAGDILIPLQANEISESHIVGEIAQVMVGEIAGRTAPDDITAYKSLGNASQDLAAAYQVFERVKEKQH